MKIVNLDEKKVLEVRQYWIDYAEENECESSDSIELDEQFFEFIFQNQSFGDYLQRENSATFVGVDTNEDGNVNALIEIIYHRRGRAKTIKIMNIYYSPAIEQLRDKEYDNKVINILSYVVNEFIQTTNTSRDSVTKIYSRTDLSLEIMKELHASTQVYKQEFEDLGIDVKLEGKRWLAFRTL